MYTVCDKLEMLQDEGVMCEGVMWKGVLCEGVKCVV